jgi:plasmid maintenance system antidote protein VapI
MRSGKALFTEFVAGYPSHKQAAKALGVSAALVDHIIAGRRNITPRMAAKVEKTSKRKYRREALVFGERRV